MTATERKYIQKLEELNAMMIPHAEFYGAESDSFMNLLSQVNRLKAEMEKEEQPHDGAYTCTVCHIGFVDPDNGYDTCDECQSKI